MALIGLHTRELDGRRLLVVSVGAPGPINLAHAATAEKLLHGPGAQTVAVFQAASLLGCPAGSDQKAHRAFHQGKTVLGRTAIRFIVQMLGEIGAAAARWQLQGLVDHGLNPRKRYRHPQPPWCN